MTNRVLIGTDPEFFIKSNLTGELVSAVPHIKGNKEVPTPLPHGGNIQADNVAVEFSTKPMKNAETFAAHLKETLSDTINALPKDHVLSVAPSAIFPESELQTPESQVFGCDPDNCAWDLMINDTPYHPNEKFRSCGGHIHVGCIDADEKPIHEESQFLLEPMGKVMMVRGMDLFHGIISTLFDSSEEATERRKLYGAAGCHRPTDYGVEYRALSNWWTKSPNSSMLVASLTEDVVRLIAEDKLEKIIDEVGADKIRGIINEGKVDEASAVVEAVLMPHLSQDSKYFFAECTAAKVELKENELSAAWGL